MRAKHEPITLHEWDQHFEQHFAVLWKQHPEWSPEKRRRFAYSATEALHGPRPPGWKWLLVQLGWGLVRSGGDMGFKHSVMWKKAIKAAAFGALVVFMASFDTPKEWLDAGAPDWLAPLAAVIVGGLIKAVHNYAKVARGVNLP